MKPGIIRFPNPIQLKDEACEIPFASSELGVTQDFRLGDRGPCDKQEYLTNALWCEDTATDSLKTT